MLKHTVKDKPAFQYVALCNIATIIVFRIVLLSLMAWWIVANKHKLSPSFLAASSAGLIIVLSQSVQLFCRCLKQDFITSHKISI